MRSKILRSRALAGLLAIAALIGDILMAPIAAFRAMLRRHPGYVFAALTVEANIYTKNRLVQSLSNASPLANVMFQAFLSHIVGTLGEKRMQILPISNLTDDVNDLDGALRVYAIYLKKRATATDAYYKLFDDATNSGTAGDGRVTVALLESGDEALLFYPRGMSMADGIVQTSHTTVTGTVDTGTGDGPDGFMVVGAA